MHRRASLWAAVAAVLWLSTPSWSQDVKAIEKNLTVHKLPNGLTVLIYRRPVAPVFSFFTHVDVGGAQEVPGITGLAHMFEHMAFKGTSVIGTKDYAGEKQALAKVDEAYRAYDAARRKPGGSDPAAVDTAKKAWKDAQDAADKFIEKNEFSMIVDREGGVGMNASTNSDETSYYYSLPANKLELWAYLESSRFLDPVFREFYKERDVVMEERRLRTESQPFGRLLERFIAAAFIAHPYSNAPIGHRSDLERYTMSDSMAFFDKYYAPANLVTAIVGGIKAKEIIPVIDKYFGRIAARPKPEALRTIEPPGGAETVVTLRDPSQPLYIEGYHKPAATDPAEPAFDALSDVLVRGRTSRLYRLMVRDKQLATSVQGGGSFPGAKYPHLFVLYAVPARGVKTEAIVEAMRPELERLKTEDITDEEMARFKTRAKADLIRSLDSNEGLAENLANYQTLFGDWRELFRYVERLDALTKADVRKAASATFVDANRTVGKIETATPAPAAPAASSGASR